MDGPRAHVYEAPAVVVEPGYVEQDDFVYYPSHRMYYGSRSHLYYYQDGSAWVSRPAPRGVSVNVLLGSPSVRMEFHDRPALHHTEIIRSYPRNWRSGPGKHGHPEKRREENHR